MSSSTVYLADGNAYDTLVIDQEEVQKYDQNTDMQGTAARYKPEEKLGYNPDIFRLPFPRCPPNSEVRVTSNYMQDLDFFEG